MASFRATSAYRLYFAELGTDPTLNVPVSSGSARWIVIRIAEDIPQGQEVEQGLEQGLEQGWAALGHVT